MDRLYVKTCLDEIPYFGIGTYGTFLAGLGERWKRYFIHVGFPIWLVTQRLSRVSLIPILDLAYRMKVMQRTESRYGRATR